MNLKLAYRGPGNGPASPADGSRPMKALIYLPLLGSLLLLGWQLAPERDPAPERPVSAASSAATPTSPAPIGVSQAAPATAVTPLPASVRGTEVDGRLELDAQGNLLITVQIRHLFDYFLSLVGEESIATAQQRIRSYLHQQLAQPARGQALALLDDYLAYQQQLADLESRFPVTESLADLAAREQAVQRLRATLFSREAHEAFFAGEEIYNNFTLERLAILQDPTLDEEQQRRAIEALRENLPETMQQLLIPQIHQELRQQTLALRAAGADEAQVQQLRLELLGPEATSRLAALDRQRSEWQRRVAAFNAEREQILAQPGLADADRQAAVNGLLQEQFNETERLRLMN